MRLPMAKRPPPRGAPPRLLLAPMTGVRPPHPSRPTPADGASLCLPGLRHPAVLVALLVALALQVWTWSRVEGYELADVVEYLDRADAFVRGEALDPGTLRSFAFSGLLVPLFAVVRLLGLHEGVAVDLARTMQMLFALGAVLIVARSAARIAGRTAGVGAAFVLACNPVLAQYAVAPLSGAAALFFIALGTDLLLRAPSRARALGAGAALGAATLMAYQCLPIAVPIAAAGLVRAGWRRLDLAAAVAAGFGALLLAQCALDAAIYGTFGSSLDAYLSQNVYGTLASLLYRLGLDQPAIYFYARLELSTEGGDARSQLPPNWYFTELAARCLAWPLLVLIFVGAFYALGKGRRFALLLLAIALANVWLMSAKGSKSFRLWLPLLPTIAVLGGLGFGALVHLPRARPLGGLLAILLLPLGLWHSIGTLERVNLRKFGAYWHAVDVLAKAMEPAPGAAPAVFASAHHWAVRFRAPQHLQLTKLPHHLDRWSVLEPDERADVIAALENLDAFIGHLQSFAQDPELLAAVNRRFEVSAVLDEGAAMEELDAVYVLRRRTGASTARTFFEVFEDTVPGAAHDIERYRQSIGYPFSLDLRGRDAQGDRRRVEFLGFDVDFDLASGRQAWVTYHWLAGHGLEGRDYTAVDRLTDSLGAGWNNNHEPTLGAWPTSRWREGSIVRESFLTDWAEVPAEFGGAYLRGQLVPVRLWLAIVEFDAQMNTIGGLVPFHRSGLRPLVRRQWEAEGGRVWSPDGLLLVGGFWWPVPNTRRIPDDGQPFPGER